MDRFVCNARTAEVGRLVGASILVDLRFRVFEQCVEKAVYHNSDADIKQFFRTALGSSRISLRLNAKRWVS